MNGTGWAAACVATMLVGCGSGGGVVDGGAPQPWSAASAEARCATDKALATQDAATLARLGLDATAIDKILSLRRSELAVGPLSGALDEATLTRVGARVAAERLPACGRVPLRLIAFNDFHGQIEPGAARNGEITTSGGAVLAGGVEYLATWVEKLSAGHDDVVVVAAGDNIGGTPLISAAFHDEPTIEALNAVGLMVSSVGNHEFDEGIAELTRMQTGGCHPSAGCFGDEGFEGAHFRYLAANVVRDDGTTLFPAYTVRRVGRAEVAFIGMTLEGTPTVVTASGVAGVTFKDEVATVNKLVPELRQHGIDAIVVLIHEGGIPAGPYDGCGAISGAIVDIAEGFDASVDVVVTGHTHRAYVCEIGGKLVTSAAHAGRLLTTIDLDIDELSGAVVSRHAEQVIVRRDVPKAARVTAIVERYAALVKAYADAVVTTLSEDLTRAQDSSGQSTLGALIADAQLEAEADAAEGGADVALMNPGGIRADLAKGPVTFGQLFSVQPFNNNLVTVTLSGAELEAVLEEQWHSAGSTRESPKMLQVSASLTYTWDKHKPLGDRIATKDIRVAGKPLDPAKMYRVVSNNFLAGGGDGFATLAAATERRIGIIDLDALEHYLKAHPKLTTPTLGRVRAR